MSDNCLRIRVSDIFTDAPHAVYHSLAWILLSKLYRKKIDSAHHRAYRSFILEDHIQARARAARTGRGRQTRLRGGHGRYIDLDVMFNILNERYFGGTIPKPRLSWSAKRTRYVLGRFDVIHNTIFISRIFDSIGVPVYVCEYVLYHEMLHVKHQSEVHDSRVVVHTPGFRAEEKRFLQYEQAKRWLKHF